MEDMKIDTFEKLYSFTDEPKTVRQKPGLGPHRFKVLESRYNEEYEKWMMILANKEGQEIKKNCPLNDSEKAVPNQLWIDCLFDSQPQGSYIDFNWAACEGRYVDAEVNKFTPDDSDKELFYVYRPARVAQQVETATVKRETTRSEGEKG